MTNDPEHLTKALKWCKRAMDMEENASLTSHKDNGGFLDTYAHLLYKLKQYDEAVIWETKAVDAQKNAGMKSAGFEEILEKMKSRKL